MRYHKFAEQSFARSCTAAGAIANPPEEDQNGWDFLVEFEEQKLATYSDLVPATPKAYVQVKSSTGAGRSCRLKLSNALRAARSPDPWFLIYYLRAKTETRRADVYIRHVDLPFIEQAFRAARKLERDGKTQLHKHEISVPFREEDRTTEDNLVSLMQSCISKSGGSQYADWKARIQQSVGFEEGFAQGTLSFKGVDTEEIIDNFLGVGQGLPNTAISLKRQRFGYVDKTPLIQSENATVFVTPLSAGVCELRFRGADGGSHVSIAGDVYTVGVPLLREGQKRLRFSAHGIEIIWSPNENYSRFEINFHYHASTTLDRCEVLATLMHWMQMGPIDFQVWCENRRVLGGILNSPPPLAPDWKHALELIKMLVSFSGETQKKELGLSIAGLNKASRKLHLMQQVAARAPMMMECILLIDLPVGDNTQAVYYASAEVDDLLTCVVIARPLIDCCQIPESQKVRLRFGLPTIRESWVIRRSSQQSDDLIERDYRFHVETLRSDNVAVFELGDICAIYEEGKKTEIGPPVR